MKVTVDSVFPLNGFAPTYSRIEISDGYFVIYECGAISGNCITEYGPFGNYREAFSNLIRLPHPQLDPYLNWKLSNPRHAWALEHSEEFEATVRMIFAGFTPDEEMLGVLWQAANHLEQEWTDATRHA